MSIYKMMWCIVTRIKSINNKGYSEFMLDSTGLIIFIFTINDNLYYQKIKQKENSLSRQIV